ncbi:Hexuronate transporter [Serratia fonticola]|uniref:Hexuronate transporter n=1 Tax=Serratia fonticola TaxID=47917 RepID=A0A4U9W8B0_SERFO|nr:Hexuronate transporter [Serratia fonticola]
MRKIKGLRWYMIGLVTIGTVLGYLTRNAMSVAAPSLEGSLGITTQQYSYIVAAYSACYNPDAARCRLYPRRAWH